MTEPKTGDLIIVENLGSRKGIGEYKFEKDPNYEYPITKMPLEMAEKIISSNKSDQEAAEKRIAKMTKENKRRRDINKVKEAKDQLPILTLPEDMLLESIRIGIPLLEKIDGRRKKLTE